ncbi:MAG TPA: (d)CMP kinase [Mycobacteriales bacterium]|nr:(d)CMP kinase [Mycobacteriales bacterium]
MDTAAARPGADDPAGSASQPPSPSRPAPKGERHEPPDHVVIAIDGPSGSGKSTVARRVAQRLGLRYLDTGAMYRAVAWQALQDALDLTSTDDLEALASRISLTAGTNPRRPGIAVNGVDVSGRIRSREVTNAVSAVSASPAVRARLLDIQRSVIGAGGIVVEGRDIGTTVVPDAPVKVFLTASGDARAARRHRQLARQDPGAGLARTRDELASRDERDSSRAASPLVRAADAFEIDSTDLSLGDVIAAVLERCRTAGVATTRRRPVAAP